MLDIAGRCKIVLRQKDYAAYTAPESEDYAFVLSAENIKMHFPAFGALGAEHECIILGLRRGVCCIILLPKNILQRPAMSSIKGCVVFRLYLRHGTYGNF
jgi:hypothetical protein